MTDKERIVQLESALVKANEKLARQEEMMLRISERLDANAAWIEERHKRIMELHDRTEKAEAENRRLQMLLKNAEAEICWKPLSNYTV